MFIQPPFARYSYNIAKYYVYNFKKSLYNAITAYHTTAEQTSGFAKLFYIEREMVIMINIVHKELRRPFSKLTIVADEIGGSDYMQSFSAYVEKKQDVPNLFNEGDFFFNSSQKDVLIQLADFISGTIAFVYDEHRHKPDTPDYLKILERKVTRIQMYPKTYSDYTVENSALAEKYDLNIANLCFRQAAVFLEKHKDAEEEEVKAQVIVLEHLLFRFMNNDTRKYISTKELKRQLGYTSLAGISTQSFRTRIIGKLRDNGVIISSSPKGYKIPATEGELLDFINHGTTIIIPMLERLKTCRDLVKLGTMNEIDLFSRTEYSSLKKYFDN